MNKSTKNIALAGLIGALYAALTIGLAPLSYGPVQLRVSECLTVLPFLVPVSIFGLYVGCMAANIMSGYGLIDIFGGSFLTLIAALLTYYSARLKKPVLAPLPPVVINAFGVSLYLHILTDMPYWLTVVYIAIGQFLSCYGLGLPLLLFLLKRRPQQGESSWF